MNITTETKVINMKTKINILVTGIIAVGCFLLHSCKSASDEILLEPTTNTTSDVNQTFKYGWENMMKHEVVVGNYDNLNHNTMKKVATNSLGPSKVTPVIADLELVEPSQNVDIASIKTYGNMHEMQTKYDVEFHVMEHEPVGRQSVILVSEEETLEALKPMIDKSKQYLYRKGFTDSEIDEMLTENNVSPAYLIPLVLALMEDEENHEAAEFINDCDALTRSNPAMEKALGCLSSAIGLDVITMLISEVPNPEVQVWTKKAIKLLLRRIAPKICGTIGVAIIFIDYLNCISK
ncbi:MAG: hypothetical protein K2K25_08850 [Muribaculaceae bacterium]|nr:hypothetical protein [Muribaculaceae bacterium]